jgi:serine/threonine protein kinase/Tol biopolymer transport system component
VQLARGTRLGPYEVDGLLGAGGMGEVYRATDTRLGRDVAVKVLPAELAVHQDRLRRFEQEARLAGSLNHPNVLALFDVGSHDSVPYLVTELLDGGTLHELLKTGPLAIGKAVDIAQQIARGLNAAHAKGIVHRDLKPANVFVTKEGHVKILDFGLAKLTEAEPRAAESSSAPTATVEGQVVGTLGYMAPEQVRGRPADARADIFAFGTVLYEMLSGRRAFAGDTAADTMSAILTKEPDDLSGPGLSIPPGLERIVRRCLEKDPEERFQSARDVAFALDAGSGAPSAPAVARRRRRSASVAALVTLVSLVAAAIVSSRHPPVAPRVTAIRQVTHDATQKLGFPVTDGTRVYYTASSDSGTRLMQAPVTGGDSVPLELSCRRPQILDILAGRGELLIHADCQGGSPRSLWLAATTGGSARPLGDIEATGGYSATWSADGQRIVYSNGNDLFVAGGDGSGARHLLTAPGQVRWGRLSPDGRSVRYVVTSSGDGNFSLWEARSDGGNPRPYLPGWYVWDGIWTPDGRYYLFNVLLDDESTLWAWREKGRWPWSARPQPARLTTGPMYYAHPTFSPDGRTIIALGQPPGTGGELVRYDSARASFVPFLGGHQAGDIDFSRDGQWIAYVRRRDVKYYGQGTLWRSRRDGTELRQLTFPPESVMMPRWSPDGRTIAYMSCPYTGLAATCESRIVAAEGGKSRPVRDRAGDWDPTWSPDGARLAVGGAPGNSTTEHPIVIQVIDVATGKASVVPGSEGWFSPRWSPDGRSIAALSVDLRRLAIYEFATGRWRDLVSGTVGCPNWTHDSHHILLLNQGAIVRVRAADGHVEPVASSTVGPLWLGIAPDDSPLAIRDLNAPPEVYALEVEWP